MPQLDPHAHYQLRLVRRFDGAGIMTHPSLAQPKSLKARDKTLDITAGSERGALQKARNYCRRGAKRKGELPGEFIGVVLVKHVSDASRPITVKRSGFQVDQKAQTNNRNHRLDGFCRCRRKGLYRRPGDSLRIESGGVDFLTPERQENTYGDVEVFGRRPGLSRYGFTMKPCLVKS